MSLYGNSRLSTGAQRLGKEAVALQKLAQQTGLVISDFHLPPGTSKWNKVEHRLFSFISQNRRGQPLLTHAASVSLIAATRTMTGLEVRCVLGTHTHPKGVKPADEQMIAINLEPDEFHGDWNCSVVPYRKRELVK